MTSIVGFTSPCCYLVLTGPCQYHTDNQIQLSKGWPRQNPLRSMKHYWLLAGGKWSRSKYLVGRPRTGYENTSILR